MSPHSQLSLLIVNDSNDISHLLSDYCMPGTILSALYVLSHLLSKQPYKVVTIIIPIFHMRNMRHETVCDSLKVQKLRNGEVRI